MVAHLESGRGESVKPGDPSLARVRSTILARNRDALAGAREASAKFFDEISRVFGSEADTKRIRTKNIAPNYLQEPLQLLIDSLAELLDYVDDEEFEALIKSYMRKSGVLLMALEFVLRQEREDYVYWIDISKRRRGIKYSLRAAPIEIAEELTGNYSAR